MLGKYLRLWWVDSLSLILDVGNEASLVVGRVGNSLDSAVGTVDAVRS